jgi:hypothetical protein
MQSFNNTTFVNPPFVRQSKLTSFWRKSKEPGKIRRERNDYIAIIVCWFGCRAVHNLHLNQGVTPHNSPKIKFSCTFSPLQRRLLLKGQNKNPELYYILHGG